MRETLFAEFQESVRDAADYRKGARVLRVDRVRRPKKLTPAEIRSIRVKWGVNQLVFAKRVGARLVQCGAGSKQSVVFAASLSNFSASRSTVLLRFSRRVDA
jgi:hypothetical protein